MVISTGRYWADPEGSDAGSYPPSPKDHGSKNIVHHLQSKHQLWILL